MKKLLLFFCVLFVNGFVAHSQIKINEVQSSNSKTVKDPDYNEYSDWIELYNTSTSAVNVGGFYLTDSKDEPRKWSIPAGTSIAAKGYLLIWCDAKNLNRHTNFNLSTDGETVLLYSNTMLLHDSVKYPVIESNFTFGRTVNGAGVFALLSAPTPGVSNVSTVVKGIAPKPTFSVPGGFYAANQTVAITSSIPGAVIRYTTDGSEPTATSPIYTGAITAQKTTKTTQKYGNNRLNKTGIQQYGWPSSLTYPTTKYTGTRDFGYVIKAKVFHTDYVSSYTSASTYFINMRKPTLPIISITSDFNNFFSADTGIYIQGTNGITNGYVVANWNQDWERKGHIEYFDANGVRQFGINAGMSTMGAVSRGYDLKSLNIVMKNQYEQGEINYPLFGASGLSKYSSFILRNSGNDWEQGNFARDGMIQSIVRGQIDLETQGYQPVVMYFNGEYWGLINMRERFDAEYFAGYNSYVDADEIDNLKLNGDENLFEPGDGDSLRFEEMMSYLRVNSMATTTNYEYVKGHYLDIDNMINYYIAQLYCQNTDWPANNFRIWRPQTENGKFRFPLFDTDFGYGLWGGGSSTNPYTNFNSSSSVTTELFDFMMLNAEFKSEFIQRFALMLNTTYSTTRLSSILNPLETAIATERDTYTNAEWTRTTGGGYNTASMISWGTSRISNMRGFLNSEYSSKGWQTLTVNYTASQGSVTLAGLPVAAGYSGQQYANTPIRLNAIPADGYQFVGWVIGGTTVSTSQQYFATITAATTISASFQTRATITNLKINEIMASNRTNIANELGKNEDWIEIYNAGTSAVDIAGLYISDNSLVPTLHKIPFGYPAQTTIAAGGYLILWADNEDQEGPLHLPFRLNKDGDTLLLSQKSSTGTITTLDNFKYGIQNTDISYGCFPDANANKIVFTVPTPNATNTVQSNTNISGLVITEFMAKNSSVIKEETGSYADWIEIYNTNATAVDLGGLFVTNDITNPNMYMIPKGQPSLTTVAAGSYFILWADKQIYINPNHVDFKLSAEKGDIAIVQVRGSANFIIDQVSYTNQGEDIAYGRFPSTASSFMYLPTPTPGAANSNSTVIAKKTGITINEVLAWNTSTVQDEGGSFGDYIEFYNASSSAVDLGGLFVSDSTGYTLKYRIPRNSSANTTVQPSSWITFWADGDEAQGPLHLGFNLNNLGEDVILSQVTETGIQQIDLKTFTSQTANVSYGRFPEASTNWETMTPTWNAKNVSAASNASLKTISSSVGTITPVVSSTITSYTCLLPSGTTAVPTISATAVSATATVTITQSTSLSNNATISVISSNGNVTQTYTIAFLIAPSTDASLKTLTLGSGTLSPAFSATTYSYTATSISTIPTLVTAIANQKNSLVQVSYPATVPGNIVITVTAESGATQAYTIALSLATTTVTSWTENFNDNTLTGWGVNYNEYTLTESNQELNIHLVRGDYTTNGYKYFYYQIPAQYLINVSANPKVVVSLKAANGMVVRIDMVDNAGRITNTNAVTKTLTTSAAYASYTYDFTGRFTDTYGTNPGTVDNTKIVALYIMIDPGDAAAKDKNLYIDNLVIGATPSVVADLATLTASAGTLSPTFAAATTSYTLTLPAGTTTIPTISATKANANATLEISQASTVDGTATVRVVAQDNATIKTYTVDLVISPSTVEAYTDYVIQPNMQGWTEASSLYGLSYLGGEIKVNYTRTATGGSDAITYNITDAASKILNLSNYPYFSVRLKSDVATNLRADLFDNNGYVTNATPIIKSVTNSGAYSTYTFDFTGKFSQTTPTQTVTNTNIRGVKLLFDAGSTTPTTGAITIDELRFGSDVVIVANAAPVVSTIPNQTIMQTQTFNNILLNNFVTDDITPVASLVWSTNTLTNLNITITNNVAAISVKNATWIGSETVTFTVLDAGGKSSTKQVTFTVNELRIPVESIAFTQTTINVAQNATVDLNSYLTITPTNATIASTTWSEASANASISAAGVLTNALVWGTESVTVTVTVTDKNSNVYTKTITVILTGCPTQLTSVSLSPSSVSVTELQTIQLTPVYIPTNACLKTVTYTSSNTAIATVNASGLVTGVVPGTATITLTVNDGFTTKTTTRDVTVTKDCSGSIVMSMSQTTLSLMATNTATLTTSFVPANECTASKIVTWSTSNSSVATVVNGVITAVSAGTATITATTDGTGTTIATCAVTVTPYCSSGTVTISLDKPTTNVYTDEAGSFTITPTILPANACNKNVTWTSSDPTIASVLNGVVTTYGVIGSATISCTSVQSPTTIVTATVNVLERLPASISMVTSASLLIGGTQTLTATIAPATAYNKTITWSTSDVTKVSVNASGVIVGVAQGSATITATTSNGLTAQCVVTVLPIQPTSVSLSSTTLSMLVYDIQTITATVLPANATDKSVVWTTSNNQVATVTNGEITASKAGTATIRATTSNGFYAECIVTVNDIMPSSLTSSIMGTHNMFIGATETATVSILPANVTNSTLTWSSSNTSAVTVTQAGVINAVALGTSIITITAANGVNTTFTVVVNPILATSVALNASNVTFKVGETQQLIATILPVNTTNTNVTWSSSSSAVVSVSISGLVTAVGVGTATVTATTSNGLSSTCFFTVNLSTFPVTQVTLNKQTTSLQLSATETLTASILPVFATNQSIVWSSTNTNIATVSQSGVITPVGVGQTSIIATAHNGIADTCVVTITYNPATSVTFSPSFYNIGQNETVDLNSFLVITPANASIQSIAWSETSSNASISAAGVYTNTLAYGTESVIVNCVVTDRLGNVFPKSFTVNATGCPTQLVSVGLTVPASIVIGSSIQLTPTLNPANACVKTTSYSSSDEAIASVTQTGVVTGITTGTTQICVEIHDGFTTQTACQTITVANDCSLPIVLALNNSSLNIVQGNTANLTTSITPNNECTISKVITWSSSNTAVATVVNGLITAISQGTATITAATDGSGTTSATCSVTVLSNCYSSDVTLSIDKVSIALVKGTSTTITPSVLPANACDLSVTWTSSNPSIATVVNGVLTAVGVGQAIITCKSVQSPTVLVTSTINVQQILPSSISTTPTATIDVGASLLLTATILPADADNKTIVWSSSNTGIVSVGSDGTITGVGAGAANVTATTANGLTATCVVTVQTVLPASVSLNTSNLSLYIYDVRTLTATVLPVSTTNKSITWSSTNDAIASVDNNGIVTAKKAGVCTIRATTVNGLFSDCSITVNEIVPSDVVISVTNANMNVGTVQSIKTSFAPTNATDTTLTWTSSNSGIISVNSLGQITAISPGTATITVTTVNNISKTITVVVNPILASSIQLNASVLTLRVLENQQLVATILPSNTTNKQITWVSSNPTAASVDVNGKITANDVGTATITGTTSNGISAQCIVTVMLNTVAVTQIVLTEQTSVIVVNDSVQLHATITPETATNKLIIWSSETVSIASVDQNGKVTGKGVGTVRIIATASNGLSDTCIVSVLPVLAQSVAIDETQINIGVGETTTASATIYPDNTTNKTITWIVLNPTIASVSSSGVITGIAAGTTTLYAQTYNGLQATCQLVVTQDVVPAISISLSSSLYLNIDSSYTLLPVFNPINTTNKTVTWTSANPNIATVSNLGKVLGISAGTTTLTATTNNGKVANISVTILPLFASEVILSPSDLSIYLNESRDLDVSILPVKTTDKSVTWTSSNSQVVSVVNGKITGLAIGTATVTAKTTNGITDACVITVNPILATDVTLNISNVALMVSDTYQLQATLVPSNVTDPNITWTSSNPLIAVVSPSGLVSGIGVGVVTITATTSNNKSVSATFTISIHNDAPTVSDIPNQKIKKGNSFVSFDLNNYFEDDNTVSTNMLWSANAGGALSLNITSKGIVTVYITDPNWLGSEIVTFYATDEQGLVTSTEVTFTVESGVGINDVVNEPIIKVFPNPTKDKVTLSIDNIVPSIYTISLYSMQGKCISSEQVYINGEIEKIFDFSRMEKGIYNLIIKQENSVKTLQIVVN